MHTEAGRLDLLALDQQGRWVVVEVKRGAVSQDTVAQIIDYASVIATIPDEQLQEIADRYLRPQGRSLAALLQEREAEDAAEGG